MNLKEIVMLVGVCFLAAPTAAQQGTTEIRGQIVDEQGAVLPGVTVTVRNQDTGMFRETVSTAEGTYFISGITPGQYEITAQLEGFKRYVRRDVALAIGRTATVDIRLEVGALEDAITVTAETPLVDVTSKEVGGNITSRELVALPSINRNYIGFIGLLPGVIPNISTDPVRRRQPGDLSRAVLDSRARAAGVFHEGAPPRGVHPGQMEDERSPHAERRGTLRSPSRSRIRYRRDTSGSSGRASRSASTTSTPLAGRSS